MMKLEHFDACRTVYGVRMAYMQKALGRVSLCYITAATKDALSRHVEIPAPECYDYLIKDEAAPAKDDAHTILQG